MGIQLLKNDIEYGKLKAHCFILLPEKDCCALGVFAHGYTSHKGDLLNWATRLCEEGMACLVFDLPGHYLGGALCEPSFEDFKRDAHKLFISAVAALKQQHDISRLVLGGHSLGALLALKAMDLPEFAAYQKMGIGVGLGMAPANGQHIFRSTFYKSTLHLREQLVSPELAPDNIFPWIKQEKEDLQVSNERIHLIIGEDDLVVGADGTEKLQSLLESRGNKVTLEKPAKLPHHLPEQAASFVKKILKSEKII